MNEFARISPHKRLASNLGYQYSEKLGNFGGSTIKTVVFRYPTVARLNEMMEAVFGEDSIKLAGYSGGSYPPYDFLRSLTQGEVMVATEQPQEYHDHAALHILGWIGLGGKFKDYLTQTLTPILVRAEEESKLPSIPGMDHLGVSQFLNPCSEVLKRVVSNLDGLSSRVAAIFLGQRNLYDLQAPLTEAFKLGDPFHRIPSQLLRIPSGEEGFLIANDIESRYLRLAEHAPLFNS